jgi:N-acetylglucosaminyldiphosphoundecaprenol N-acetyl-beta-D-mannosaminyltransferase
VSDRTIAPRVDVLGVHVNASTFADALSTFTDWIESGRREYVTFTGVHGVMESQRDPELVAIHNAAGFVSCDGMPLVWSCHAAGYAPAERVYGPDVMLAMSEVAAERGFRVFLYGGNAGTPELLATRLQERFPGLQIVGTLSPPFRALTDDEIDIENAIINEARPDIVWVGLSTPKQERWMAARRQDLDAPLLFGVGAAFDFHAGLVRQAPSFMQRAGLEWLFRLGCEPRRLWRRYCRNNPAFLVRIARARPSLVAS